MRKESSPDREGGGSEYRNLPSPDRKEGISRINEGFRIRIQNQNSRSEYEYLTRL